MMTRVCVCVCGPRNTHTHSHTLVNVYTHTDKRRITCTRKIFVEIMLPPQGGKLEKRIIFLRLLSLSFSFSLSSHRPHLPSIFSLDLPSSATVRPAHT